MDEKFCEVCGTHKDINIFFRNLDQDDKSEKNILNLCEACRETYNLKIAMNAVKTLVNIGLKVDNSGSWVFDNETIRKELSNVKILEETNKRLKRDIIIIQDKLHNLVSKYGYDTAINLNENERLLDWENKKDFHCWTCGTLINWHKRDGRYYSNCNCGKSFYTEINRIKVVMI